MRLRDIRSEADALAAVEHWVGRLDPGIRDLLSTHRYLGTILSDVESAKADDDESWDEARETFENVANIARGMQKLLATRPAGAETDPPEAITISGVFVPLEGVRSGRHKRTGKSVIGFPVPPQESYRHRGSPDSWPGWEFRTAFDSHSALSEFVQVEDGASALRFAKEHGPLWHCSAHGPGCPFGGPHGQEDHRWSPFEPVEWWLRAASAVRVALRSHRRLVSGDPLTEEDWAGLVPDEAERLHDRAASEESGMTTTDAGLIAVCAHINSHLQVHPVTLEVEVPESDVALVPAIVGDFGFLPALWREVFFAVAGEGQIAVCSSCAVPYFRQKRAKSGQRNFCPDCRGTRVAKRMSEESLALDRTRS